MGINSILNERLNGYELRFGSGLSPNRSEVHLLGGILANGLVEWVCTRRPDWPVAAGALGLGWLATGPRGRLLVRLGAWPAGPSRWAGWVSAHCRIGIRNSFSFFQIFYNLQTNLNPIQIWISTISTRKIKYKNTSQHKGKYALVWNETIKYIFKYINL
jgi:hypothetical protein